MKHICAWCKCETAPPDGKNDDLISHDICQKCKEKLLNPKTEIPKKEKNGSNEN